ncbi:hypothetical protein J3R30DRAFT_3802640 [Lentinula aciculospora]|uniref:Uncharacterized protein n=1 Tax=Lentinula aciculospora TaxID=153920 RepID=A0A9W8ZZ91_9AGAR|nr:hypothetical protein J3R30DRAFT_3802640 [Lentinula aciculospora]
MSGRPRALTDLDDTPASPYTSSLLASASAYEHQSLTPRTPRSRAGFSGYDEVELGEREGRRDDEEEEAQSSAAPLLRSNGIDVEWKDVQALLGFDKVSPQVIGQRLPLVAGSLMAGFLLVLVFLAYHNPGTLEYYIGATVPSKSNSTSSPPDSYTSFANSTSPVDPSLLISYANYTSFPLVPIEYVSECYKIYPGRVKPAGYWGEDGVPTKDVSHHPASAGTCSSTITYMLDGRIGLASDLALMAQIAALARERNRTFLVDDTYWNRGKWTDHFQDVRLTQPGPEPGCLPPPPEELVACPRQVRHWIINSHTTKFHLGDAFADQYEDAYARNLNRQKPIFLRALDSLSQTIRPSRKNAALISQVRQELHDLVTKSSSSSSTTSDSLAYIGVHIRHGDQKAKFTKGPDGYVPIQNFVDEVKGVKERFFSKPGSEDTTIVYVASDDPVAIKTFESSLSSLKAFSLHASTSSSVRALASPNGYVQADFNALSDDKENSSEEHQGVMATRGVIVDMALVSGLWMPDGDGMPKPDAVVCTIGSSICLLSALPLSWSAAFGDMDPKGSGYPNKDKRHWLDIDQKGAIVPAWKGFQMF